jgi:hypothetical protein
VQLPAPAKQLARLYSGLASDRRRNCTRRHRGCKDALLLGSRPSPALRNQTRLLPNWLMPKQTCRLVQEFRVGMGSGIATPGRWFESPAVRAPTRSAPLRDVWNEFRSVSSRDVPLGCSRSSGRPLHRSDRKLLPVAPAGWAARFASPAKGRSPNSLTQFDDVQLNTWKEFRSVASKNFGAFLSGGNHIGFRCVGAGRGGRRRRCRRWSERRRWRCWRERRR